MSAIDETYRILKRLPAAEMFSAMAKLPIIWEYNGIGSDRICNQAVELLAEMGWTEEEFEQALNYNHDKE